MADTSKITLGQLKTALTQAKNYTDNEIAGVTGVAKVEPEELDMPKVFFNGGKPTTKDSVYATIEYVSSNEHFKGYVDIKCQGTSSMAYPKKNYTIKMFEDEARTIKFKKDFKGWGKQNKFCLKANYIDHSHARNIVSAKLWNEIVASRSNYQELPELLRTSPMNGAIDGFPIKVYYNNTYEGVYTWNIPKDKWMFNMDDALDNHCVLCGEEYESGCFRRADASLWSDEIHDAMPESIKTSFNNFISFVMNSSDDEFKANLSNYVYVDSLIDYYIFQYAICGLDSMGKNQLFATYDGTKWIATSYDMDSTFGLYWNGQKFVSAQYRMQEDYESMGSGRPGNLLYIRLEELFIDAIKTRYAELRASVLSYANIVDKYERFMDVIGKDLYAEDLTIYTGIPSEATNNIQQIRNYTRDRLAYVDAQIEALTPAVPCTGITLSANTLSFTSTDTQTITATVQPTNTTDVVTWSVSPTGVVTVNNGVITPVANGDCTITATCGSKTATCVVNVALPSVACTSISLDKTELTLGKAGDAVDTEQNYLEGVGATTGRNVTFNSITLSPGSYIFKNINGGTFTWLGYTINGTKEEPNGGTTNEVSFLISEESDVIFSAYPNNNVGNTSDKLGLYKIASTTGGSSSSYQLISTINPPNTTDALIWSVEPQGIVTVVDGLVTAEAIGNAIITATCGTQSATCNVTVSDTSESGGGTPANLVFQVDSTSMNILNNTLTDKIAGISATLTGNPTVRDNQIAFDVDDTFSFDISSLNLTSSNRTFRIKFTPTNLDTTLRNIIGIGSSNNSWDRITSSYITSEKLILQHGPNGFNNNTVGSPSNNNDNNRLTTAPVIGQEYELVISEHINGNIRWFIDGTLVQNGTTTLFDPLYLSNAEGVNRFIGSYSLIEIYDAYCVNYAEFTNMIKNTSGVK